MCSKARIAIFISNQMDFNMKSIDYRKIELI